MYNFSCSLSNYNRIQKKKPFSHGKDVIKFSLGKKRQLCAGKSQNSSKDECNSLLTGLCCKEMSHGVWCLIVVLILLLFPMPDVGCELGTQPSKAQSLCIRFWTKAGCRFVLLFHLWYFAVSIVIVVCFLRTSATLEHHTLARISLSW